MTPPGLVVPVTRNCTLAVLSKPLPLITTSRLMVPCVVDAGVAAVTLTCAHAAPTGASARSEQRKTDMASLVKVFIALSPGRDVPCGFPMRVMGPTTTNGAQ